MDRYSNLNKFLNYIIVQIWSAWAEDIKIIC